MGQLPKSDRRERYSTPMATTLCDGTIDDGVDAKDAQVLMGHAQFSTTMDIYTHVKDQRIAKTAKKLNKFTGKTKCV